MSQLGPSPRPVSTPPTSPGGLQPGRLAGLALATISKDDS